MKWLLPSIYLFLMVNGTTYAQLGHFCTSQENHQNLMDSSIEYAQKAALIEKAYQKALTYVEEHGALPEATYTIPVVFHIMHAPGEAIGSGSNISLARIQTEIDNWNEAFDNTGAYAGGPSYCGGCGISSATVDINFCLATQDPLGFPTDGVNRFPITYGSPLYRDDPGPDTGTELDRDMQSLINWNSTDYFNVWVVDEICKLSSGGSSSSNCGVAGYAYYPSASGAFFDGSVVEDDFIGVSTNLSKVMVHEAGHYFNLRHTFEGGCAETDCTTGGDFVCDTPPDNSTSSVSCASMSTANTCSNDASITNSPFGSDVSDMYENYMDYGFQSCQNTFTPNQGTRMEAVLMAGGARVGLTTSNGCGTPSISGTEVAFSIDARTTAEAAATTAGSCESYRDIEIMVKISKSPSSTTTVTFSKAGTATDGRDYLLLDPSVSFTTSSDLFQYATIRIYNDAIVEGNETIILTYSISGGGGASAAASNQTMTITIKDDDVVPGLVVYTEDFESGGGWTNSSFGATTNRWRVGSNGGINGTYSNYVTDNTTTLPLSYNNVVSDDPISYSPLIDGSAASNATISFQYKANGSGDDFGRFIYRLGSSGPFSFISSPTYTGNGSSVSTASFTLPTSLNNNSFQIGFWWINNGNSVGANPPFAVDDISISVSGAAVGSSITSTNIYFGGNETAYIYGTSGNLLMKLENLSSHDYGCTTVEIDRAGSGSTNGAGDWSTYPFLDKTFKVTPSTNNPTGSYSVTLYYTESEIAGWENTPTAGTNNRANLSFVKSSGAIGAAQSANSVSVAPSVSGYGTDWAYSSTFSSGFSGFGLGNVSSGALPLELMTFDGEKRGEIVQLDWKTENEINSSHFDVEHSMDSRSFKSIGIVNAKNEVENKYQFNDTSPEDGINYYRLKMVDYDGKTVYSNVVAIDFKSDFSISVSPNPIQSGEINILINSIEEGEISFELRDIHGSQLQNQSIWINEGFNQNILNATDLPKGVYFLRVQKGQGIKTIRVVNN